MVVQYKEQRMPDELVIWCDSDWAGCRRTRKSTSGAMCMFGKHCLKTFSRTQDGIALSSGEAEFVAIVEAACTGLGIQAMLSDMGIKVKIRIMTDSSAAKSMVSRRGVGRVRHLDVKNLWVQERVARGDFTMKKVPGEKNLADPLTKNVTRENMEEKMSLAGFVVRDGRHHLSPELGP